MGVAFLLTEVTEGGTQGSQRPALCSQLEWAMKLWWPHSEAMIAFLMGYSDSGDPALLHLFYQVAEYTFRQVRGLWAWNGCGRTSDSPSSPGLSGLWEGTLCWAGEADPTPPSCPLTAHGPSAALSS